MPSCSAVACNYHPALTGACICGMGVFGWRHCGRRGAFEGSVRALCFTLILDVLLLTIQGDPLALFFLLVKERLPAPPYIQGNHAIIFCRVRFRRAWEMQRCCAFWYCGTTLPSQVRCHDACRSNERSEAGGSFISAVGASKYRHCDPTVCNAPANA